MIAITATLKQTLTLTPTPTPTLTLTPTLTFIPTFQPFLGKDPFLLPDGQSCGVGEYIPIPTWQTKDVPPGVKKMMQDFFAFEAQT